MFHVDLMKREEIHVLYCVRVKFCLELHSTYQNLRILNKYITFTKKTRCGTVFHEPVPNECVLS
jgi:hypothetical protein